MNLGVPKRNVRASQLDIKIIDVSGDEPNTRVISETCSNVWPKVVPVVSSRGFMPESSDKAGGFMKLRYTRGQTGWLGANRDIKTLTEARDGFIETYRQFGIVGASLSLAEEGSACRTLMQIEYNGFSNVSGWVSLPSNGHLESDILFEISKALEAK